MLGGNTAAAMNHQTFSRMRGWGVACFLSGVCSLSQAADPSAEPAAAAPSPNTAAEQTSGPRFDVFEFEIEGNTVLDVPGVEQAVSPFLGEGKTMNDVEAARAALEKIYQDRGFLTVFVDIPEQQISQGVVQLKVMEGRVERLSVMGSRYYSQGYIRDHVPELSDGKVPNFTVVQAQLADVNRNEDRRVQPVLRPGRTPGTVEAELKVTDQNPVHGSVEMNNRQAQYTTPWRLSATVSYGNLFQRDHTISLTALTAPAHTDQSQVLALAYTIPLPNSEAWLGYAVYSNSTVAPLGASTVLGKGTILGLRRVMNLPSASATFTQGFTWGFDYKNLKEDTLVGDDRSTTPVVYLPFSIAYNGNWQHSETQQTQLTVTDVFAQRNILQRTVNCDVYGELDQFDCKREGADGSFSALKIDLRHSHGVFDKWTAHYRFGGQVASGPLISSEQYALGGVDTVRGYLESDVVGDNGLMGSFELRSPNWAGKTPESWRAHIDEITAYGFGDAGRVYTIDALPDQHTSQSLASLGLGLKLRAYKTLNSNFDLAWPLKPTDATPSRSPKLHVRLAAEF